MIEHQIGKMDTHDERNLLPKIALQIVPDLQPRRLKMTSDVPLARGWVLPAQLLWLGLRLPTT